MTAPKKPGLQNWPEGKSRPDQPLKSSCFPDINMSLGQFARIFMIGMLFTIWWPPEPAYSGDLSIKTRTKYYSFRAKRFRDVSRQMLRHGPGIHVNGRRVWALARREYDWHLDYSRVRGRCTVKNAKVRMKITYVMPRMENEKRVSRRFLAKWHRVFRTLLRHEHAHGRNYQLLAKRLKAGLKRLKPAQNCFALNRAGKHLDKRLHQQDLKRNRRLEGRDRGKFTRMQRRIERS
jgi:predicted secreted Zn-dependent protease